MDCATGTRLGHKESSDDHDRQRSYAQLVHGIFYGPNMDPSKDVRSNMGRINR